MSDSTFHLPVNDTWYRRKYNHPLDHEQEEFKIAIANSDVDSLAIDVGANCGVWTFRLAQHFKYVKAYEPLQENFTALSKNITSTNSDIYCLAIGSHYSPVYMCSVKENTGGSFVIKNDSVPSSLLDHIKQNPDKLKNMNYPELVIQTTIDDEIKNEKVGFIKIDVEGYEFEVLQGATQTIQDYQPLIMVEMSEWVHKEVWGYHDNAKDHINKIKSLLNNAGYQHIKQIGRNFFFSTRRFNDATE